MGSRHKSGRQRYGGRPIQIRPTLPIVTIVCDDTKTAVAYFAEIKREVKATVTVRVEAAPRCGASPDVVLQHARLLAKSLKPKQKGDSFWVLLDTEAEEHKQTQASNAKQRSKGSPIQVLLSRPCYEVWTLAHFVATGQAFADCNAVVARMRTEWERKFNAPFGSKKAQADYAKLMPLRAEAVRNAKKRNPDVDASWTEVYLAVEAISWLCGEQPPPSA